MEGQLKLHLVNSAAHERLSSILYPYHRQTHLQENLFFDGPNSELSSNLAALGLRFYDLDTRCILSLKSKPQISAGISRIEEQEDPFDPTIARQCVAEPWRLLSFDSSSDIIRRVKEEFKLSEDKGLVCLGGFRNVRAVYEWNRLKLEIDETHYGFGTCYEVECESSEPERAKDLVEGLLRSNGIEYKYTEVSKFTIFRAGKLPQGGRRKGNSNIKLFTIYVFLLVFLFVLKASQDALADQCKVELHYPNAACDDEECLQTCRQSKGHAAAGQCELIDMCVCRYPC